MNVDSPLSDLDRRTLHELLRMEGPNPSIVAILEQDKALRAFLNEAQRVAHESRPEPTAEEIEALLDSLCEPTSPRPSSPALESVPAPACSAPVTPKSYPLPNAAACESARESLRTKTARELHRNLVEIVQTLRRSASSKRPYDELRVLVWAINSELTRRDEAAPCVRPQPGPGMFVTRSELTVPEKLMLNDRQMFDLEFAHKHRLGRPKSKWEPLLRSELFDPMHAAAFIVTVGRFDNKIDALKFRDDEQVLLGAIRSEKIRKRWTRLSDDVDGLNDHLSGLVATGASRIAPGDIPQWCEDYVALALAGGRPTRASALLPRLYSRSKPANQFANRKADLRKKGFPTS